MAATPPARLFIGSSREGAAVAYHLHAVLADRRVCEVDVWDGNVFEPSGYALDSLVKVARGPTSPSWSPLQTT